MSNKELKIFLKTSKKMVEESKKQFNKALSRMEATQKKMLKIL